MTINLKGIMPITTNSSSSSSYHIIQWRIQDFEMEGRNQKTLGCRREPHVPQEYPARGCLGHAPSEKVRMLGAF